MGAEQSQMAGGAEGDCDETEMPTLSAVNTPPESTAIPTEHDWNYLDTANKIRALNNGYTFFTFSCKVGNIMTEQERTLIDMIINLSCFEDETATNNVPKIDIFNDEEAAQYSIILVKTAYMLPRATTGLFTPEFLATPEYHTCCEPGNPVVWEETPDDTTFRLTKTVIPYVYDLTIQMKVSAVTGKDLERLTDIDDLKPSHCLLLERTKRNPLVVDATRKCKSVLVYYEVPGGVLCINLTAVLNTSLPAFIVPFIDSLGYYGSREASDTATLTRAYLRNNTRGRMPPRISLPEKSTGDISVYQETRSTASFVPSDAESNVEEAAGGEKRAEGEEEDSDEDVFEDASSKVPETDSETVSVNAQKTSV